MRVNTGSAGSGSAKTTAGGGRFGVSAPRVIPTNSYAPVKKPAPKPAPRPAVGRPAPAPKAAAVARRVTTAPAVNRAPAAPAAPPKPPPAPMTIEQFLAGDTTYMGQNADLQKAMANFDTQQGQQNQQYGQEYNLNKGNLDTALTEANTAMSNDYGSRGMLNSGLYGQAYADQQTEYNGRQAALDNARTQFLSDQTAGKTNFTADQGLTAEKARQDAINRRAASLGL